MGNSFFCFPSLKRILFFLVISLVIVLHSSLPITVHLEALPDGSISRGLHLPVHKAVNQTVDLNEAVVIAWSTLLSPSGDLCARTRTCMFGAESIQECVYAHVQP